ncbi:unnamed protein product [Heligmosomoides polygyrus]|uniref:Uncharacterized protein n=1 Tax=Heligmosomoides polygyrus TaxID=6339 RepID=A0A3P8ENZ0_HELPZ|nr:unnamed protein product [Heligmosomoides polygyrus]
MCEPTKELIGDEYAFLEAQTEQLKNQLRGTTHGQTLIKSVVSHLQPRDIIELSLSQPISPSDSNRSTASPARRYVEAFRALRGLSGAAVDTGPPGVGHARREEGEPPKTSAESARTSPESALVRPFLPDHTPASKARARRLPVRGRRRKIPDTSPVRLLELLQRVSFPPPRSVARLSVSCSVPDADLSRCLAQFVARPPLRLLS